MVYLPYETDLEREAEWLRRGAPWKVESVERLLAEVGIEHVDSVLEVGAGTGAVLEEMRQRGLSARYIALEPSEQAVAYLRTRMPDVTVIPAALGVGPLVLDATFDLVVASHVLEHLNDPDAALESLRSLEFCWLCVEVPLEDLPAARLKAMATGYGRHNTTGHVQFFNVRSFRRLLRRHGLVIRADRRYSPVSEDNLITFQNPSGTRRAVWWVTRQFGPRWLQPVWSRLYYGHYAMLCEKAT